jgi:hypothetical protein
LTPVWEDVKARERLWHFLRPRLHHPSWREPILLLAGMMSESHATELARRILRARSHYERELHRDLLLASDVVREGTPLSDNVANKILSSLVELYLDRTTKRWHRWLAPVSIWVLLIIGFYLYVPAPYCLIPFATLVWWGVWLVLSWTGSVRLKSLLSIPHRLSGRGYYVSLRAQLATRLADLPESHVTMVAETLIRAPLNRGAPSALQRIGEPAIESLINTLDDQTSYMPSRAAWVLGAIGDQRAAQPLIRTLENRHYHIRTRAAWVLGTIGDQRAVQPLLRALRDKDERLRGAAASALGTIGDQRAMEPLIHALDDEDALVRRLAATALGTIDDQRAVEPLIRTLRDEDKKVREEAAWALRTSGDQRAVEPLIQMLRDA